MYLSMVEFYKRSGLFNYGFFIKEPIKDNFSSFAKSNCGVIDEVDYKKEWPDKENYSTMDV